MAVIGKPVIGSPSARGSRPSVTTPLTVAPSAGEEMPTVTAGLWTVMSQDFLRRVAGRVAADDAQHVRAVGDGLGLPLAGEVARDRRADAHAVDLQLGRQPGRSSVTVAQTSM